MEAARTNHVNAVIQSDACDHARGRAAALTTETGARIFHRRLELARALSDYLH